MFVKEEKRSIKYVRMWGRERERVNKCDSECVS